MSSKITEFNNVVSLKLLTVDIFLRI